MATIALVDDDKNILASVTMLLEQEGYHVRSYTDGASALTALSATPPEPRHFGHQNAPDGRHGAAAPVAPDGTEVPVIFLTSKDEEIDELMGLNAGADDYIRKPFSQRLLLERVKAVLRRAEGKIAGRGASAAVGSQQDHDARQAHARSLAP
jgi:two-component system response regulator ChvI